MRSMPEQHTEQRVDAGHKVMHEAGDFFGYGTLALLIIGVLAYKLRSWWRNKP